MSKVSISVDTSSMNTKQDMNENCNVQVLKSVLLNIIP